MNTLSIILYLAPMLEKLSAFLDGLIVTLLMSSITCGFAMVGFYICRTDYNADSPKYVQYSGLFNSSRKYFKTLVCWLLSLFVVNILVPSERTVYLILASELGEEIILSEPMQDVYDIIVDKIEEFKDEQ